MIGAYLVLILVVMLGPTAARAQTALTGGYSTSLPSTPADEGPAAQQSGPETYPTTLPSLPSVPKVPTVPGLPQRNTNPAAQASQQQSGMTEAQAQSLLRQKGYNQVVDIRAQPNSLWVWQADAMRNGRRVTLGIDYRGNVVETSSSAAQPCTSVGARPGAIGGFSGSRLVQADRCSGQ